MSNKEIWKPIFEEDQATGYEISSFGSVRDGQGKLCKLCDSSLGYYTFYLKINGKKKRLLIHRLVALNFVDNPDKLRCVQHVDGNMFNNNMDNLKWVSHPSYCIPKSKELIEVTLNEGEIWKPLLIDDKPTDYCKFYDCLGHYTFYFKINGKREKLKIHRLVALNFIDNPDNFNYVQHVQVYINLTTFH